MTQYRIGLIGYGTIGHVVTSAILSKRINSAEIVCVLVRDASRYQDEVFRLHEHKILLTDSADAFFMKSPDLVVEVASQESVVQYGPRTLKSGCSFMVSSIGAFTDDDLFDRMTQLADIYNGNLYLVAGALPGADWMQGASFAEVYSVKITQTKPVKSWQGTPADKLTNLNMVKGPVCFFTGTAREAAGLFRKSSNITAMLALTTVGMDQTEVVLVADPNASSMQTIVEYKGEAGELIIQWKGVPSDQNPSTSKDVALNVIKAISNICSSVKLGV